MLVTTPAPRIWSSLRSCSLLVPRLIVWDPGSMFNVNNSLEMQTEHIESHSACGCSVFFFLQLNSADEPEEEMHRIGSRKCPDVPSHSGTVQVTLLPVNSMWQHSCNPDIQGNVPQCSSGCSGLLLRLGAKAECGWSCFSALPEVNLLSVAQCSHKSYCENRQWHSEKPRTKAFLLAIASQKLEDYLPRAEGKGQSSSWVKPVIYYPVTSWSCSFI